MHLLPRFFRKPFQYIPEFGKRVWVQEKIGKFQRPLGLKFAYGRMVILCHRMTHKQKQNCLLLSHLLNRFESGFGVGFAEIENIDGSDLSVIVNYNTRIIVEV